MLPGCGTSTINHAKSLGFADLNEEEEAEADEKLFNKGNECRERSDRRRVVRSWLDFKLENRNSEQKRKEKNQIYFKVIILSVRSASRRWKEIHMT
jgi:hypothetical protein